MIQVRADNEMSAQFVLEIDFTQGRLHCTWPVPPGKIGAGDANTKSESEQNSVFRQPSQPAFQAIVAGLEAW